MNFNKRSSNRIAQAIIQKVLKLKAGKPSLVVALCGAADLGKSFLAKQMVELLKEYPIESSHLTLDSFLMDRADRKKNKISGYDIRAHDMPRILEVLKNWHAGQSIQFQAYDHHTGSKSKDSQIIPPCEILIIEGLFSLHESLLSFIDLSFFIYTDPEQLKKIKLDADLVKRNYTSEYARQIYDQEFARYQENIEPLMAKADYKLYLKEKWHYELEVN